MSYEDILVKKTSVITLWLQIILCILQSLNTNAYLSINTVHSNMDGLDLIYLGFSHRSIFIGYSQLRNADY